MTNEVGWLVAHADGRFRCPRRLWAVDLGRCLGCNWLVDLDRAGSPPSLRCAATEPVPDGRRSSEIRAHLD
ncbi:MAG TPA: hypothetical protein VGT60_02450 [Candidatus Limnocylindria bacterium]|nr:hypothetical protein [Candidatus Limnocylindria bacterium]